MDFKVLTQYLDYIESLPLADARIGILSPGRYCGFDTIVTDSGASGIPIKLKHSLTGVTPTNEANMPSSKEGAVLTPHGVVIKTADDASLIVAVNADTEEYRYDLIYLEYTWVSDITHSVPTIAIHQGTAGAGIPTLVSPEIQVCLGVISLPPSSSTFADLTYTPQPVPLPGGVNIFTNFPELDSRYARLAVTNRFTKLQSFNITALNLTGTGAYTGDLVLPDSANAFAINAQGRKLELGGIRLTGNLLYPVGTRITLVLLNVGNGSYLDTGGAGVGTQSFRLSAPANGSLLQGPTDYLLPLQSGDTLEVIYRGVVQAQDIWEVINPAGYIQRMLNVIQAAIQGLSGASNWQTVQHNTSSSPYRFSIRWGSSSGLNYRKNSLGQTEITGLVSYGGQGAPVLQICALNPAYCPGWSAPIILLPELNVLYQGTGVINAYLDWQGGLRVESEPPVGNYYIHTVLPSKG